MAFDVEGAKAAGYTDAEIAKFLDDQKTAQPKGGNLYQDAPPGTTKASADQPNIADIADVPGGGAMVTPAPGAVAASRQAWSNSLPTVVGGNEPGYVQSETLPLARRTDAIVGNAAPTMMNPAAIGTQMPALVTQGASRPWYEGWAVAPGPFRALGQSPAENITINPTTGTMNIAPEALSAATMLGGVGGLRFGQGRPEFVPPGTFDRQADLTGLNQFHPDATRPPGPTSPTGVPLPPPQIETHAVPPPDAAPTPATSISARPMTAADAKTVANQYYKINATQGGRTMPPEFINALSDDLNTAGPKGPLETAIAGETPIGRMADEVQKLRDTPTTLEDAQRTYSRLGDAATEEFKKNGNSENYRQLMEIQANMRDRISPPDLAGDDPWTNARRAWAQAMKMDDVERMKARADGTQNPTSSYKTAVNNYINGKASRGWSGEEKAALVDSADRGAVGGLMHVLGSRLLPHVGGAVGAGVGGFPGFIAGEIATHVAGGGARQLANYLQQQRVNQLMNVLGSRVPAPPPNQFGP